MAQVIGVTGRERLVIRTLGRFPGLSAGQLGGRLAMHPATLSAILAGLDREKLLDRRVDPVDRRRIRLGLTAGGRALDRPEPASIEATLAVALARIGPAAVDQARRVLDELAGAMSRAAQSHGRSSAPRTDWTTDVTPAVRSVVRAGGPPAVAAVAAAVAGESAKTTISQNSRVARNAPRTV
jgi:DNA-binding MarR family transcriptional regulator